MHQRLLIGSSWASFFFSLSFFFLASLPACAISQDDTSEPASRTEYGGHTVTAASKHHAAGSTELARMQPVTTTAGVGWNGVWVVVLYDGVIYERPTPCVCLSVGTRPRPPIGGCFMPPTLHYNLHAVERGINKHSLHRFALAAGRMS